MKQLILISCVAVLLLPESHAKCLHSIVAPKGLRLNTPEEVYIDFHDCEETVSIRASLMSLPNRLNQHDEFGANHIPHGQEPVLIPLQAKASRLEPKRGRPYYKADLDISYCFADCAEERSWTIVNKIKILLNATHGYAFMTTDRPAYRPGETVKITLAVTNQDLKTEQTRRDVHILIKTPVEKRRVTVRNSGALLGRDGFIDFSYNVPGNPIKGVWWAEAHIDGVKMAEKSFVVDKYELPTFDVKIVPKYHFILPTQTHIEGRILAEYSYGKKVDGNYYMSFKLARRDGTEREFYKIPRNYDRSAKISQGERTYKVPMERLLEILRREGETLDQLVSNNARLIITASVTGYSESVFESDYIDDIIFTNSPFVIDHSRSARFYLPHTIYELKLTVRDVVSGLPLPHIPVKISWGRGQIERFASDDNGEVYHLIDNLRQEEASETISITTESGDFGSDDQGRSEFVIQKYDDSRQIAIRIQRQFANVGDNQHIVFGIGQYSPPDIRYFVISRGRFVHVGSKILQPGQEGEVADDFTVTAEMVPIARVIAYYILEEKVTSNSAWFDVQNTCKKELEILTDGEPVLPGNLVTFRIKGAPNMPVQIVGVDRAAYFVHNGTRVSRNQLWSKMEEYDTACSRKGGLDAIDVFEEAGFTIFTTLFSAHTITNMYCEDARNKRSTIDAPASSAYLEKKMEECKESGLFENLYGMDCDERRRKLEENMELRSMPVHFKQECLSKFEEACEEARDSNRPDLKRAATSATKKAREVRQRVRKDFEESWGIPRATLGANGFIELSRKTKHSITTFELDAFGMSENAPMCVAETKYVTVFKNFFIQLYLPYSVRLREQATIKLSVFYYGDNEEDVDKQIDVYVKHSEELCSRFQSEEFVHLSHLHITSQYDAVSTEFTILPIKIPDNNEHTATITILAQSEEDDEDLIEKKLLIEKQGVHNESSGTIVLQPGENVKHLNFDFPDRSVIMLPTRKCEVYLYAHPMGPVVEIDEFTEKIKIGNYIRLPRGCGEQNMIIVAPVIYIHSYRMSAMRDQVTAAQKDQVLESIQKGYDNELGHRADSTGDKAFAVWHNHDPSTWLNAFVTKVFSQALEFWPEMNTEPICDALEWMLGMQKPNGRFSENYRVYHAEMRGLVTEEVTLTSYVTISIAEAAAVCPTLADRIRVATPKAIQFVKSKYNEVAQGSYSLAMGAYAIAISEQGAQPSVDARLWNTRLMRQRQSDGGYFFWRGTREGAANIETTAYALLAELALNGITNENDDLTRNIAHWLISKRNANGGFKSTQDTVVAMQALATYMTKLDLSITHAPPPTNLNVVIKALDEDVPWRKVIAELTADSTKEQNTVKVPDTIRRGVGVTVGGVGTGSLSYRCTWRQYNNDDNCQFQLSVEVADDEMGDANIKILKVDVSKTGTPAQMSIIDVGILSGFEPDEESIKRLTEVVDYQADRYEITENTVKFYLSSITENPTKLAFKIKRGTLIKNGQPAAVSAYDYYEPDMTCTKFYTLQGDDYHIRTTNCDGEDRGADEGMCKCAEGDCPICRTREQQLHETICSYHAEHLNRRKNTRCGPKANLCTRDTCYNLHRETCTRDYLYVVEVREVGIDETPGFKYFRAFVVEVLRTTGQHPRATNSTPKFLIREDCFNQCTDSRFEEVARKKQLAEVPHFINVGRLMLVYGSNPTKDKDDQYVYDLTANGGLELLVEPKKCKKGADKENICIMRSILRAAHILGCD